MRIYRYKDVVGSKDSVSLISRATRTGKLKNFIILHGPTGSGKSTIAETTALYKSCEAPMPRDEPCLECETCKRNIAALQNPGASSSRIIKKNVAEISKDSKRFEELVRQIFILDGSTEEIVYILEDADQLDRKDQTVLLEHIDRLGHNVFVIMVTTNYYGLIEDMRGRGVPYPFRRLSRSEVKILFDRTVKKLGMKVSPEVEDMILKGTRGSAREIVKHLVEINDTPPTLDELRNSLGVIPHSVFFELMNDLVSDMRNYKAALDLLFENYNTAIIVPQVREFFLSVYYACGTGESEVFSKEEVDWILSNLKEDKVYAALMHIDKFSAGRNATETDLHLLFLKIRQSFLGGGLSRPITANSMGVVEQKSVAARNLKSEETLRATTNESIKEEKVTLKSLDNFRIEPRQQG